MTPYITAVFVVAMMLYAYYRGYQLGKARAARDIFKALGVPDGAKITGVSYRIVETTKRV